jgi:hypothetical protein
LRTQCLSRHHSPCRQRALPCQPHNILGPVHRQHHRQAVAGSGSCRTGGSARDGRAGFGVGSGCRVAMGFGWAVVPRSWGGVRPRPGSLSESVGAGTARAPPCRWRWRRCRRGPGDGPRTAAGRPRRRAAIAQTVHFRKPLVAMARRTSRTTHPDCQRETRVGRDGADRTPWGHILEPLILGKSRIFSPRRDKP